jgi:hypothetical protein
MTAQKMLRHKEDGSLYIWTPLLALMPELEELDSQKEEIATIVAENKAADEAVEPAKLKVKIMPKAEAQDDELASLLGA